MKYKYIAINEYFNNYFIVVSYHELRLICICGT